MDLRKLKTLIDLVSDSNVSELEITEAEGKVRIVKGPVGGPVVMAAPVMAAPVAAPPASSGVAAPAVSSAPEPAAETGHLVKSPMVGTFYRSASPESDAFVEVGSVVKEGQTICIIEAMKILNEIEADKSGTIAKIHPQNAQAVEYGSALFDIE